MMRCPFCSSVNVKVNKKVESMGNIKRFMYCFECKRNYITQENISTKPFGIICDKGTPEETIEDFDEEKFLASITRLSTHMRTSKMAYQVMNTFRNEVRKSIQLKEDKVRDADKIINQSPGTKFEGDPLVHFSTPKTSTRGTEFEYGIAKEDMLYFIIADMLNYVKNIRFGSEAVRGIKAVIRSYTALYAPLLFCEGGKLAKSLEAKERTAEDYKNQYLDD